MTYSAAISDVVPGLHRLQSKTLGDPAVRVAVLDGYWNDRHAVLRGCNLTSQTDQNDDVSVHGMQVASILAGQPTGPLLGIAPQSTYLSFPALAEDGSCSQAELASSIASAREHGAHIVCICAGAPSVSGRADAGLSRSVQACHDDGILIVAAAGNDGCACLHVPGALPTVFPIGAMDREGKPLQSSNWGEEYGHTGILAPGHEVPAFDHAAGEVGLLTGTSAATAVAAGTIALFLALQHQNGDSINPYYVAELLRRTANDHCSGTPLSCRRLLRGRLDLMSASREFLEETEMEVEESSAPESVLHEPGANTIENKITVSSSESAASSECVTCETAAEAASQVYVIGTLDVDFVSESRHASLAQEFGFDPSDRTRLIEHLKKNPVDAASLIWTLNIDESPEYVIAPTGPFAKELYSRLVEFLDDLQNGAERVALAGVAGGTFSLRSRASLPVLFPEYRAMASWSTKLLVEAVAGEEKGDKSKERREAVTDFLERLYYSCRNLGMLPSDRAKNYAATNAFNINKIFESAIQRDFQLDEIYVERAPIGNLSKDLWDVRLAFFDPENTSRARRLYQYSIDVADVPYAIAPVRSWSAK